WYAQGGNAYLWTPVNGDLVWVTASGFVGIGATPSHPLTVRKDAPANLHTASFTNAAGYGIFLGNLNNNLYGSIQSFGGGSHQPLILQPVGGSVGLGTTNPQSKLHVVDVIEASEPNPNVRSAMLTGDGAVELLRTTSSTPCPGTWGYVDFKNSRTDDYDGRIEYGTSCQNNQDEGFRFLRGLNGTLSIGTYGPSGWGHSSDARRKTDIQPLTNALERVLKLRPVYFRWRAEPTQRQVGFLAQEVEPLFPEVVSHEGGGEYVLYHGNLTAPLTAALQELYEVVKAQAEEIQRLRQRIEALERASKP
ncbi:MAG: tail fiber domain-containing protein, partial [Bacteroidia bacterium]|nr:tail fiber domain-containing protein [Bacteroidia bacterium]